MNLKLLENQLGISSGQIKKVIQLFDDGATVPFIARYRKEVTQSLDEVQILAIKTGYEKQQKLIKRKESILDSIKEQGKLTPALQKKIEDCWDENLLEDIYLPFKKSRKTKADLAKEKGLEGLAKLIWAQKTDRLQSAAKNYINKSVKSEDEALEGARHIIAEWINQNLSTRQVIREAFTRHAFVTAKVVKKKKEEAQIYTDYFDYSEPLKRCPSHRLLAVFRGEEEGMLKVKIGIDEERAVEKLSRYYVNSRGACAQEMETAIKDSLKRLIFPSIENETKKIAKQKADLEAIKVFANNLKQLLLSAPLGEVPILALDPGFRTGCKVVVLDAHGGLLKNTTIYPHPPQQKIAESTATINELVKKYKVNHIAIGNGTAGRESYQFLQNMGCDAELYMVNENGASIYSASEIARVEFPDQDLTVRGAVSIGRRLIDPLAELVKLDPKSIGVGQYQHDVNQTLLKEELNQVVESCVNAIGVNLNTASPYLLQHVSGLGPKLAENIIHYRQEIGGFQERKELLKVPRMGKKAYEQAAGFLRIKEGKNPLDNTGIHPERYTITKKILKTEGIDPKNFKDQTDKISGIKLSAYTTEEVGMPTLKDIVAELKKPGIDPRGAAKAVKFSARIKTIEDLEKGMILTGIVNNLTKFGAFVDIGIKDSALLHISEITNKFIKDPAEVLSLNQEVQVKVIDIDVARKRISITMKFV